jgi:hypothetical protein
MVSGERVMVPFASFGEVGLLDQSTRSGEAISGSGRTLSGGIFTEGRTERDFLRYSLGELGGH